jgi:hypothetical protein
MKSQREWWRNKMPKTFHVNIQGFTFAIPKEKFPVPIRFQCCDCGLVHVHLMDQDKDNILISIFRDEWDTMITKKKDKKTKRGKKC